MNGWLYITPEQGALIKSICDQFWTGCKGEGCKKCPLMSACTDNSIDTLTEPEKTRTYETRMWELADKALSNTAQD